MNTKSIIIFLSGIGIGSILGVFSTKKYFEKKFEESMDQYRADMEEYYGRTDEYVRGISESGEEVNPIEADEEKRENGPLSSEERKKIKEKLVRNHRETTNYAQMYKKKSESENITEEEYEPDKTPEEEANEDHQQCRNQKPRIISFEKIGEVPGYYEKESLYYYVYDQTLTTDEDELIEEEELLLGDCLDKYGFRDNDEEIIFVQNFATSKIYEVQKIQSAYGDLENSDAE